MAIKYDSYSFIFPPRPENKISPDAIGRYEQDGRYIGQPKYNGSNCVVFMNDKGFLKVLNRHNEPFSPANYKPELVNIKSAYRGKGFMVLCGELLNKSKRDEAGKVFNQKFVIWDILVYNGQYLIGSTLDERLELLEKLYPEKKKAPHSYFHLIDFGNPNIFRSKVYENNFAQLYEEIIKTDMQEGFVMKRRDAKLEYGLREMNNHTWQVKVRKPTKNYRH